MVLLLRISCLAALAFCTAPLFAAEESNKIQKGLEEALARHKKTEQELLDDLNSSTMEDKIGAALVLWAKFPATKPTVLRIMHDDPDPDVRRRVAQVLAAKYKVPEAVGVLEEVLTKFDTKTEYGAQRFISTAHVLQDISGKSYGSKEALAILGASEDAFPDAGKTSPYPELRKDGLKTMAASHLARQKEMSRNSDFEKALRRYIEQVLKKIASTNENERRHWQRRLRTLLDIAIRADMPELALANASYVDKIEDEYDKPAFRRMLERARKRSQKKS